MRRIAIISIIFLLFISISLVSADNSLENVSLTTNGLDASISQELSDDNTLLIEDSYNVLNASSEISIDNPISYKDSNDDFEGINDEISVDDSNYEEYFSVATGKFKNTFNTSKINTLKIGNVSDKLFTFDKPLNIMPISSDCQMTNCVIHLISGSDRSNITGLTINNTKGEIYGKVSYYQVCLSKLHGIWITNSSYNLIYNNTIRIAEEEGCYAMPLGWSNYNRILNNNIISGFTSCIVMGSCHFNNISYNKIEINRCKMYVTANCIYFNSYGHADYSGPSNCTGNYIFSNYFKSNSNSDWSVVLKLPGHSNKVINNTVIRGYYGIACGSDDDNENIVIEGNTIINSTVSINTIAGKNSIVSNNKIIGFSQSIGIWAYGNLTICDNIIDYVFLEEAGIFLSGHGGKVYDNKIKLSTYGIGIIIEGNDNLVTKNTIDTKSKAINIQGSNNLISNNIISTISDGVVLSVVTDDKIYDNSILFNKICSDRYAVVINGHVYNTQIHDNIIESNSSEIFYIDILETLTDRNTGKIWDNNINGVIEDSDTIIIDDNNFHDYFDDEGYFKHEFGISENKRLFLTFLSNKNIHFTDQIVLTSNKQPNLLYNVTITFSGDACDSSINDLKFYNFDKPSIILDGVDNVDIKNNQLTMIASDIFDINVISVIGGCYDSNIVNNDIFITSNADYTYAILISEPSSKIRKQFSTNLNISNNNIFIKSSGVSEGIYADALSNSIISSNNINIVSDDSAYGIAIANVFERPHDIKIDSNEITIYSKDMSYLIEIHMSDSIEIINNYLKGISNGIYGVGVFSSNEIDINKNEIVVVGKDLTENGVFDALGKGNAAIYVYKYSQVNNLSQNILDVDNCEILIKDSTSSIDKFKVNYFVISPYNYDLYFNSKNKLINKTITENDVILFKNFTTFKTMNIEFPVLIKPYKNSNQFTSYLILSGNYSNLDISGFFFKNTTFELNNVNNVKIINNTFISSKIHDLYGDNNCILNNSFIISLGEIIFDGSRSIKFAFNNIDANVNGDFNIITSNSSINNTISFNTIIINSTGDVHVYNSLNTCFDSFLNNNINVMGDYILSVVYYDALSSNNHVMFNNIISNSSSGRDYAVLVNSTSNLLNVISNNYLISSNGYRKGNDAVNASYNSVHENAPADLYVSAKVNVSGDGSIEHPYSTIHEALENAVSGSTIYLFPGCYNESDFVIDKNINLTAINLEGNTYINALNNRLFEITKKGTLSVNGLKIFNGFSVDGGGLFYNEGSLIVNNCMLYNSSSYYDNSNPVFITQDKKNRNIFYTYNCENLGLGGAILNYGDLVIDSSNLFDNYAHKGGALADFGKTIIKNSLFYNNVGVHGGAIFTDSKKEFNIDNSYFHDNIAITSLDYCYIKKDTSITRGSKYFTQCDEDCGSGGAIFSNSPLVIYNSLFEKNIAKSGGAIASDSDLQNFNTYGFNYLNSDTTLFVSNTVFKDNVAKNTMSGNMTLLQGEGRESYNYYSQYFNGGAIFGSFKKLTIYDSFFENNLASENGGALSVQCDDSTIEGCKFYNNTACGEGGAFSVFGNFNVVNTEIIGNNAQSGGAVSTSSDTHIQKSMVMFNVTVANNMALYSGGAFLISRSNLVIKNSNIYGNNAVRGETFYDYVAYSNAVDTSGITSGAFSSESVIDARGNWWGSDKGPDDSILYGSNVQYLDWASEKINWGSVTVTPSNNDNYGENGGNNGENPYSRPFDSKTGSSIHTGSTLVPRTESGSGNNDRFNFPGNWPSQGNSYENNNFPGNWPSQGNGNENGNGLNNNEMFRGNSSSNSETSVKGMDNQNSMSKINSSEFFNDLSSVGNTPNAADSSTGSQYSSNEGESSGSTNAYEIIKDVKKDINEDLSLFNILFIILWILLVIGFYRKYHEENNN